MTPQNNQRSLGKFYLVIGIFVVPMIASWLLYFFHDHFHLKTLNHGELLSPPIQAAFLYEITKGPNVWRIVHVDKGSCDAACENTTYQLNQVRKVLGKDQDRLLVVPLHGNTMPVAQLQREFQKKNLTLSATQKIYLIDPLGNLFMYYPDTAKPMDVLKDIKRVIGVSQIG